MKILADVKSTDNLELYQADGLIFSDPHFSCAYDTCLSDAECKKIIEYCRKRSILVVANLDKIIEEEEVEQLYRKLECYLDLGVDYFIFGDLAILKYFLDRKLTAKLIYDPKTLITNYEDARFYRDLGLLVTVSNELSLEEIKAIIRTGNCTFDLYGHHQMFYSRRPLLSAFASFIKAPNRLDGRLLYAQEELREERYPLYENAAGTVMYTSYRYALFKELPEIRDSLVMGRINGHFIPETELLTIISLYKRALQADAKEMENLYQELLAVNPKISSGFLEKKSVLFKEED